MYVSMQEIINQMITYSELPNKRAYWFSFFKLFFHHTSIIHVTNEKGFHHTLIFHVKPPSLSAH